jgi:hypothetical protein
MAPNTYPPSSYTNKVAKAPTKLEDQLVDILSHYCGERGDNEGAVETLERIVEERNTLLRRAIERDVFNKN